MLTSGLHGACWAQGQSGDASELPVRIRFQGNGQLGEDALRTAAEEELKAFEQKGHRLYDADDAAFQMESEYRKKGYAFARVDYEVEKEEDQVLLSFTVDEGPRVTLAGVKIQGNEYRGKETLRAFFPKAGSPYVAAEVRSAVSEMRDFYYQSGFLDVKVEGPEVDFNEARTEARVAVSVKEGPRYRVVEVRYEGDVLEEVRGELKAAAETLRGKSYVPRRKLTLRSLVTEAYENLGYADANVSVENLQGAEAGDVILEARVRSGPRVRVTEIQVEGNEQANESFIRHRLAFEPGDWYSAEAQRRSFRNLYRTGLFSKVDLHLEETPDPEARTLVVTVAELPSQELYLEPGWGSYEYLRFSVGYREKDLFGTGRIARAETTISFRSFELLVGLTDPWFLNTEITADFPVYYRMRQEPSFTREDKGASALFSADLTDWWSVTFGYDYRHTDLTDVSEDADIEDTDTNYALGSLSLQTTFDTRDDIFFPTGGQRTFLGCEAAQSFLLSDVKFAKFTGGTRWYFSPTKSTVLALRYDTGLVVPTGDQVTLPLAERFFNGGENTVRSFYEAELGPKDDSGDPTGGYAYNVVTVEVRQRLYGNFFGSLFWDFGNLAPNQSRSERDQPPYDSQSELISDTLEDYFTDFRSGVGAGLQYLLPVGPARLDFAVNPSPRKDQNEDRFAIHFSVGMAF